MKGVLAALLAASGLPALAQTSRDMDCSRYDAMNAAGQMAAVNSMLSSMSANKMVSSHVMAKKVSASCKDHPGMMVHEVMKNAAPP
jgi:hypothetical protein